MESRKDDTPYMFPTSVKELKSLGWDYIDVIFFTGDAFVDHPSFGTAMLARVLQAEGYRVAVVPQPGWKDDLRDFRKFGAPRLFFGVNAGAMDSMVNHYTAARRLRSDDAYTPNGRAGARPDRAVTVYTRILKSLYPDVPVVIGGIEASLRRLTHYDYWDDRLHPSVLADSGADLLSYGMGEKAIVDIARAVEAGLPLWDIPQTASLMEAGAESFRSDDTIILHSYEQCLKDSNAFAENFNAIELEANRLNAKRIVESVGEACVVVNPPYPLLSTEEMDAYYALPFTKLPHPRYKGARIPAFDMIFSSLTIHRGCFGGCAFCTIAAHQGRFIQSRSKESVLEEVCALAAHPSFKGVISDIGAPTANMWHLRGKDSSLCEKCSRKSCLWPKLCPNMDHDHSALLELYREIDKVKGVRHSYIGSGIRYDLFLDGKGFIDQSGPAYLEEVVLHHTSGRLKVAPEHTEDHVLDLMHKPSFALFEILRREFEKICRRNDSKFQIVPYFISSHPGCTLGDMEALRAKPALDGIYMDQVQDFTPTPMTASSVMFYCERELRSGKKIFVEKSPKGKQRQKSVFFEKKVLQEGKKHYYCNIKPK